MAQRLLIVFLGLSVCLAAAGCSQKAVTLEEYNTSLITLPNTYQVRAEVMMHPQDVMRGMMFRDELAPDRGMLFIHGEPGQYPYWMYQVRIPLDIIWLNENRRIVEMSPNTPPCETKASHCPSYGGNENALYVLELAAGSIEKHGLRVGAALRF